MSAHFPPNCDAACRAKIILNSGRVIGEIKSALALSEHLRRNELMTETEAYQLIEILDEAEDKLIEWNNRRLNRTGYKRRTKKFTLDEV